jgi:hypothetical protein
MIARIAYRSGLALSFLLAVAARPAQAQLQDLNWRLHGGLAVPMSGFGEYFEFGPTVGLDVGYPLATRLDLKLDVDLDVVNRHHFYPTPDIQLWRYRLGLEVDPVGEQPDSRFLLRLHAGAGATTFRSTEFWPDNRTSADGAKIRRTALTGTGGVRVGLRTGSGLEWWLGGKLNWSPLAAEDKDVLRDAVRNDLDPLGGAVSAALTLGFNLSR